MEYQELNKSVPVLPRHRCTDCLCALLFLAHVAAFIAVAIVGYKKGNPDLILYPFDTAGHQCGRPATATSDYKYLYFVSPAELSLYSVCVKHCDDPCGTSFSTKWVTCIGDEFTMKNPDGSIKTNEKYGASGLLHFCLPEKISDLTSSASSYFTAVAAKLNDSGNLEWAKDIMETWPVVLYVLGASIVFSILYLILLRLCALAIILISIVAIECGLAGFGYFLYKEAEDDYPSDTQTKAHDTLKILAYCLWGGTILFALIILFMWRRIKLAVAITKSAVIFMGQVCNIMIIPFLNFLVVVGMVCLWIFALVYLYSCGTVDSSRETFNTFGNVKWDNTTRNLFYYEVIGFVWIIEFKIFLTQMAIALIVAYWYFDHGDQPKHHHKIFSAYWTAIRYHLGSVAFAALLLTIVKLIKWFLEYLQKKVYKQGFDGNKAVKFICGCVGCYVRCFERFIKFLDKNALIGIAYSSKSFCASAKEVLVLMVTNAARFVALGSIGELFSLLGKTLVTLASTAFGFYIITHTYKSDISSPVGPAVVYMMIGYCVSSIFLSVFETVCDCIIIFYLEDERLNGAKASMHAPKPLHDFMTSHRNEEDKPCCCCL